MGFAMEVLLSMVKLLILINFITSVIDEIICRFKTLMQ